MDECECLILTYFEDVVDYKYNEEEAKKKHDVVVVVGLEVLAEAIYFCLCTIFVKRTVNGGYKRRRIYRDLPGIE